MRTFENKEHNDLISPTVRVEEILKSGGETRKYKFRVRTADSESVKLIVWDVSPASKVDWQQGKWYQLQDALIKKWSSNVELNAGNKTTAEQVEGPISKSNQKSVGQGVESPPTQTQGKTSIVHTTNTYLDRKNMGRRSRQDDYLAVFEETIDYAQRIKADAILHTGNLFWSQSPSQRIIEQCKRILEQAASSDIDFYLLFGERDLKVQDLLSKLVDAGLVTRLAPRWNQIVDIAVFAHDATVDEPESGFHYPPGDQVSRIAVVHDDIPTATSFADVNAFESEIGWSLDAILLGNQDEQIEVTKGGVKILSPGPPERVIRKRNIDLESLSPRYVHRYDITSTGIDVQTYETSSRPVAGFRIELSPSESLADIEDVLPIQALEGAAAIFEITGVKDEGSPSNDEIQDLVGEHAAVARGYDERVKEAKSSGTGISSWKERPVITGLEAEQYARDDNTVSPALGQGRSDSSDQETESERPLTDIPGVGETRAEYLSNAGFSSLAQVADAAIKDLSSQANLDREIAKCIRLGAQEIRGDADTELARLAEDCDVDREDVADAYAHIAYHLAGTLDEKVEALYQMYSNEKSILTLEETSIAHLYSLYVSGFQNIRDVAQASIDELTEAPYITSDQAKAIQDGARGALGYTEFTESNEEVNERGLPAVEEWDIEMLASATTLDAQQIQSSIDYLMSEGCARNEAIAYMRCYLREMLRGEGLFAVSGVGPSSGCTLVEAGITDIDDLQASDPEELSKQTSLSTERVHRLREAAKAGELRSLDPADEEIAAQLVDSQEGSGSLPVQDGNSGDDSREPSSNPENTEADSSASKKYLEHVPGIASTRGRALREAGYVGAHAIASAEVDELQEVPKVSNRTARCIQETAKELCGYQDTLAAEMARVLEANRDEIAEAYNSLATAGVTPEEARPCLKHLFDDEKSSIFDLTQYSLRYRHFLFQNGFSQISDVAEASLNSLTEAKYIGEDLAESIRETARDFEQHRASNQNATEDLDSVSSRKTEEGSIVVSPSLDASDTRIESEIEELVENGSGRVEAEVTITAKHHPTSDTATLWKVSGIGLKRGHHLYHAGFRSASDIADASVEELAAVRLMSESSARCVRESARNFCGHSGTMAKQLADEIGEDREEIAKAYDELASYVVPPEDAIDSIKKALSDSPSDSIFNSLGLSLHQAHFLSQEGFGTIADISGASISELENTKYFSYNKAKKVKKSAQQQHRKDQDTTETRDNPTETVPASNRERSFPSAMVERDQWLLWKETSDGRKIPRAPWKTEYELQFVDAMDPSNWTTFQDAIEWSEKLPHSYELAFCLSRDDPIVFVDLDNAIQDGEITASAQNVINKSNSYTATSTSGTGLHIFITGKLSDGVKAITDELADEDGSIEVYDRNRFVAMTGDHVSSTPETLTSGSGFIEYLESEYAEVSSESPDKVTTVPNRSREELREIETTTDIQDIFDAIAQTQPSDIRMRSTQTKERRDGTSSYNPSWTTSESGTRLGVLDEIWIYRDGMIALDALQVVALEEGLITDEREYPDGDDFWDAVEELRNRGADIPNYESKTTTGKRQVADTAEDLPPESEIAQIINYGEPIREYIHPYDRDYQEDLALELAPVILDCVSTLDLPRAVAYRTAEIYMSAHAANIVPGQSHECTIAAALRIASLEASEPRPWEVIGETLDEDPKSIRNKLQRIVKETKISDSFDASDMIVKPEQYIPHLERKLNADINSAILDEVRVRLQQNTTGSAGSPLAVAAGVLYAVLRESDQYSVTQDDIAQAASVSSVTVRNNYKKFIV